MRNVIIGVLLAVASLSASAEIGCRIYRTTVVSALDRWATPVDLHYTGTFTFSVDQDETVTMRNMSWDDGEERKFTFITTMPDGPGAFPHNLYISEDGKIDFIIHRGGPQVVGFTHYATGENDEQIFRAWAHCEAIKASEPEDNTPEQSHQWQSEAKL